MTDREKLIEVLNNSFEKQYEKRCLLNAPHTADDLIANGVTVQRWIPVTERLPEKHGAILAVFKYGRCKPFVEQITYRGAFADEVTHWMPLPEAPKEGEA